MPEERGGGSEELGKLSGRVLTCSVTGSAFPISCFCSQRMQFCEYGNCEDFSVRTSCNETVLGYQGVDGKLGGLVPFPGHPGRLIRKRY